ncbi:PREDICTED: uncharacterized protein LOC105149775 [Acromyrmex echinatior]|uniref:uncharacterized protein LOC105149775 n=1 Tax=Acromyrmex echinatior TaxID=103372 RepID=UPI000580C500|nr:PREDICTED: uncharacterized protein LOC105149775 [Acromyrmex echinatior]
MVHLLFGGTKTKPQRHKTCRIYIGNLDGTYKCDFVALQQNIICQNAPCKIDDTWMDIFEKKDIRLSDTGERQESISLLIGADVAGKIFTGKVLQINQGITALEIKLEWTILEANISDLWRLDVLGITDPVESVTKEVRQAEIKTSFQETTKIDNEGDRYEVLLPWKENHPSLRDNRDVAEKRLKDVTKRLRQEDLFDDYQAVFDNWLEEVIIERVPVLEVDQENYYLPHRPVVKKEKTMKIRPVFDASAKVKESPSLNQCLETGPNLIEFIPALLHRFRKRKIGKAVYEKLAKSFYVDDCVTSVNSYSDFEVFRREACSLLTQARFDLRDWKYTGKDPKSQSTVLGLIWDTKRDILICPVVLDSTHLLTLKIIFHIHLKLNHAGIDIVMNSLREKFFPAMSSYDRVRDVAAFEVIGIDYAGPLFLSGGQKAYMFTCAVYREVHLELVTSVSTEEFLEAFRRFIARRGRPTVVYSDNGKNFVGARNLLQKINWRKVFQYCALNEITWHFNPPSVVWWGGWWERLIRLLKDLLKRTLKRISLSYEEMNTVLCDCEATMNLRPLTYLTEENTEITALTPAMFISDIRENGVPDLDQIYKSHFAKRIRYRQRLKEEFRKRFRIQYLGQLSRRTKPSNGSASVASGTLCLLKTIYKSD